MSILCITRTFEDSAVVYYARQRNFFSPLIIAEVIIATETETENFDANNIE